MIGSGLSFILYFIFFPPNISSPVLEIIFIDPIFSMLQFEISSPDILNIIASIVIITSPIL